MIKSKFNAQVAQATLIVALIILLMLLILKGFKVILLILAGILFSIYFLGVASFLEQRLPIKKSVAVIATAVVTFSFLALLVYLLSPRVSTQIVELQEELPKAWEKVDKSIERNKILNFFVEPIRHSFQSGSQDNGGFIKEFFSSVFGVVGDIYVIIFLGFFFIANPSEYTNGIVSLFPKPRRQRAKEVLHRIGETLRNWLLGKLASMFIVGILVSIGLLILGVPLALTLGIFTAILAFIPNIGPLISLIPALLISFSISNELAMYTFVVYMAIQAIESNLITPFIHKQLISMPMAMVLIAQVFLGLFTGYLGLIMAVPIVAIIMVVVKMVYLEDILEDDSVKI